MADGPSGNPLGLFYQTHAHGLGGQSLLSRGPDPLVHRESASSSVMNSLFIPRYGEANFGRRFQTDMADRSSTVNGVATSEESYEEWRLKQGGEANPNSPVSNLAVSYVFDNAPGQPYPSLSGFLSLQGKSVIVTLTTGDRSAPTSTWHVHEHLLLTSSSFFRPALKGGYKETYEGAISFPEATKESLMHFVTWLYSSKVPCNSHPQLIDAYVFGTKIDCVGFVNAVMGKLYEVNKDRCQFGIQDILFVDENVLPHCALRRFMTGIVAQGILLGQINWGKEQWEKIGGELAVEVNMAITKLVSLNWFRSAVTSSGAVAIPAVEQYLE